MKFLSKLSVLFTLLVMLAGGIVRTTGSGMGCPDWPKCFGQYIPPTNVSQLPPDYKTIYAVQGKEIADFSVFKTYVEYINRLLGAILGIIVLALCIAAIRSKKLILILLSTLVLVLTLFEAWLGKIVVDTDLNVYKITLHMLFAILILLTLLLIHWKVNKNTPIIYFNHAIKKNTLFFLIIAMSFTILQILLGTEVREQIDEIAKIYHFENRNIWVGNVNYFQKIHASIAWVVLLINLYIVKEYTINKLKLESIFLVTIIALQMLFGMYLAYFGIPAWAQPVHMILSNILICTQFYIFLRIKTKEIDNTVIE